MKRLLSGIALVLAAASLVGQEAEPPVFPAGTEAVLLDTVARDAEPGDTLRRYVELVERYRAGSHDEAVFELRSWEPDQVSLAVDGLLDAWREPRWVRRRVIQTARVMQAASLLHADAMLAAFSDARQNEHELQIKSVRRLLRPLHSWQLGEDQPDVRESIASRDLYLGIAAAQLGIGAILQANVFVAEYSAAELGLSAPLGDDPRGLAEYSAAAMGVAPPVQPDALIARHLRDVARDREMLLLAGCAQEGMPVLYRRSPGMGSEWVERRTHEALRRAERFFRHTLDLAPESAEARLRLGWTLLRRGKRRQARAALEEAAASGDPAQVYLAWLFLGRLGLPPREVIETAAEWTDATVYAVAVRGPEERSEPFLDDVARATGGRTWRARDERDLRQRFLEVLQDIRARYLLTYTPEGSEREGWHEIEVRVRGRRGDVLARPGYHRSKPPGR